MEALRRIRTMRGMNQVDLAKVSGVAQNTISEIELGKREARPGTLKKIADALNVEISDLFGADIPKVETPEQPPETFVDRLLRAPGIPIEELSDVERAEYERTARGEKPRGYFVPPKEGEESDVVTLRIHYVRLMDENDHLLQRVRELERQNAALNEQLEKAGREPA